jgi:hypothetical protein
MRQIIDKHVAKLAGFCFISDTPRNRAITTLWIGLDDPGRSIWPELLEVMSRVLI